MNEIELASLTRYEKVSTTVIESTDQGAREAALAVAHTINECVQRQGRCVMALGFGRCVTKVYDELVKLYFADKVSFAGVIAFSLGELRIGDTGDPEISARARLHSCLYSKVDIEPHNIHTFNLDANLDSVHGVCKAYEQEIIDAGGLDLVVCELHEDGSLAYNEPGSSRTSACRLMRLGNETRNALSELFQSESIPTTAVTLGMGNILSARHIVCVAWGEGSADAVYHTIEGKMTDQAPATFLHVHNDVKMIVDLDAASQLTRINYPWKVTSCEWNDYLMRRAIVWLSEQTGKPVLKLTNKDYNEYGLSELVALYDSAYNVNIKVFNELQHTITGWPGGKPNADDTYRPERAAPYPKRVLIFSPHPDDATVSMGGTVRRLVQQGHDVYLVFETDGDVAVSDEDLLRTSIMGYRLMKRFRDDDLEFITRSIAKIENKQPGAPDDEDNRYMKGALMLSEAYMAARQMGIQQDHLCDLRLPFYVDDPHGQGKVTEADAKIIEDLIVRLKPTQIFMDNDLADPHNTHARANKAVMMAINNLKDEAFMRDCRVWMYRGQWGQWDVDQVEMAVPMSPEEFGEKRSAILKFQSQMQDAPFRTVADGKLSWQRSIERNRDMAVRYQQLGLATYEAIEAFVQYRFKDEATH